MNASPRSGLSREAPLVLGVIGAGEIVRSAHLPAMLALQGARVDWIVDRDDHKAKVLARSFGLRQVPLPSTLEALPPADAVLIAVPYGVRPALYRHLSPRSAVYVEKPFARTVGQHDAQCALFRPERLAVGFQKRSAGPVRAMQEVVRSGMFGELVGARVELGAPATITGGRHSTDLAMAGGGILFEVGVHAVDLALYIAGVTFVELLRVEMVRNADFDIHTDATLRAHREGGEPIQLDVLVTNLRFTRMTNTFVFEKAEVDLAMWSDWTITVRAPSGAKFTLKHPLAEYPLTSAQIFHEHWSVFLEGIRSGKVNPTCAAESRATTQVIDLLYAQGEA
jgi:predicted dehydrogenase